MAIYGNLLLLRGIEYVNVYLNLCNTHSRKNWNATERSNKNKKQ